MNGIEIKESEILKRFPQDGGSRSYTRIQRGASSVIIMDYGMNGPVSELEDFVRIGKWLSDLGIRTPEIYELDLKRGRAMIEDFGDITMKAAIESGKYDAASLYDEAIETLRFLRTQKNFPLIPDYYRGPEHLSQDQLCEWYIPEKTGRKDGVSLAHDYFALWDEIEAGLPECSQGFIHADYHAENLMVVTGEDGYPELAVIDFQSAKFGPYAYDFGNILWDMRRDVEPDIRGRHMNIEDEDFQAWTKVLTARFHCRLLGQIVRWDKRDGKTQYRQYLPRIESYMDQWLKDPLFAPLAAWFGGLGLDFSAK